MSRGARSLASRLTLLFSLVAIVPVLLITLVLFLQLRSDINLRVQYENETLAKTAARQIQLFLEAPLKVMKALAVDIAVDSNADSDTPEVGQHKQQTLDGILDTSDLFEALYMTDGSGRVFKVGMPAARSIYREEFIGLRLGHRPFIQQALASGKTAWSETFLSVVSGKVTIAVAIPVGEGLLVGNVVIGRISEFVRTLVSEAPDKQALVVDKRGDIIAFPQADLDARQRNISQLSLVELGLSGDRTSGSFRWQGHTYAASVAPIAGPGWATLVIEPANLVGREFKQAVLSLLIGALGSLLFALFVAHRLGRWTAAPLGRFSRAALAIANGEYHKRLPLPRSSEEHELGAAFENMQLAIRDREETLVSSERRYRTLFEASADGVMLLDHAQFIEANERAEELFGCQHDELIGRSPLDFSPDCQPGGEASETLALAYIERAYQGQMQRFEWRHLRHDGVAFSALVTLNRIMLEGAPYLLGIVRDITPQKRAEEEAERLRNFLANVINSMPSLLVAVDQDNRVTQWNDEAERRTGIALEQALNRPLVELLPHMAPELEKIANAINSRQVQQDSKVARQWNGQVCFEDIVIYPLITNGASGAVIRIDDVTDQVRMEEAMVQSEKMLSVGGLAAGMAHEINNPLAGILQNMQVIKNRLKADLSPNLDVAERLGLRIDDLRAYLEARKVLEMLDTVEKSGQRAAQIVHNMLSFVRKSESRFSPTSITDLLQQTLELCLNDYDLKRSYDFRLIEICREFAGDLPQVPCEKTKIQQVLLNILRNAAQAMHQADVDTPRITLRVTRVKEWLRIEMEDNGPGMDAATQKRVFEPFFTTKDPGEGTGLGLSVSYFIITENHRGQMTVASTPGRGTRFTIELPLTAPPAG